MQGFFSRCSKWDSTLNTTPEKVKEVEANTVQPEKGRKKAESQAISDNDFIFCGTSPWQLPQQHQHLSHKPQGMEKSFPLLASAPHSWQGHSHSPEPSSRLSPPGAAQVTWNRGFQRCHGTELWLHDPGRGQRQQYWSLMPAAWEHVSLQIWLGGLRVCCRFGPRLLWLSLRRWQTPEPEVLQMGNIMLLIWRGLVCLTCGDLKCRLLHLFSSWIAWECKVHFNYTLQEQCQSLLLYCKPQQIIKNTLGRPCLKYLSLKTH